jgi:hypothetical protein
MMKDALEIRFRGAVDDSELEILRDRVGLRKHGRLSDDWDAEFGSLVIRPESEGRVRLDLYRDLDNDGLWSFSLTFEADPPSAEEILQWEGKIKEAIAAAGLTVESVKK